MTKRRVLLIVGLFALLVMLFSVNAMAASDTPVKVKVQTSLGTRDITTTVGEIFTTTSVTGGYKITSIKSFGAYSVDAIRELHIPYDATEVSITTSYSKITSLIIDDYSKATITSITGLVGLKTVKVGTSSTVTFGSNCLGSAVTKLDLSSKKTTVTFSANSFANKTNLKELLLTSNSTYNFGNNCFKGTGIEELRLVDGATVKFTGAGAFYGCTSLRYVYAGDGVADLKNSPFDNCGKLEMVFIKSADIISANCFRAGTSGAYAEQCQLKVYAHTTSQIAVDANAFANRNNKGVIFCALATDRTSFNSCKYELHCGITHAYAPATEEKTCYTTYTTDCECGYVRNAYYKLYQNGKAMQIVELIAGPNPDVPHSFTGAYSIKYENGICQSGVVERKCSVCSTREGVEREAPAIVVFAGYSVSEKGAGMAVGIRYNSVTMGWYEEVTGEQINYGLLVAAKQTLGGNNPLTSTGEAYSKGVYKLDMEKSGLYESTMKLTGLSSATINAEFIMSGYIMIGNEIYYIQGKELLDTPEAVKYLSLKK